MDAYDEPMDAQPAEGMPEGMASFPGAAAERARLRQAGETILDRYVVERVLGCGSMGVVYACFDGVGGVEVAVKALPPELARDAAAMEEVRANFQLVSGLRHSCIAGLRTLEMDREGECFLVMDIAEGERLREWIARKWKTGGTEPEEVAGILRQVASALDYAHAMNVLHRDVKPENIMVDSLGRAKVLDFGVAGRIAADGAPASEVIGTGAYMAPEQWLAQPQDAKTDQYALGAMAYEMLSGRLPFHYEDLSALQEAALHGKVRRIPGLGRRPMAALRRALAKNPQDRWPDCQSFVEALSGHAPEGRKGAGAGWLAALLLAGAVGAGAWAWRAGWGPFSNPAVPEETAEAEGAGAAEAEPVPEEEAARLAEERMREEWEERIRQENEEREETVYRLVSTAKAKTEELAEKNYDRGQGFGWRLDGMREKTEQGNAAVQGRNFAKAQEYFEGALGMAAWVEGNGPLREAAVRARDAAETAKGRAEKMGAAELAGFRRGEELGTAAERAFERAAFRDAAAAWNSAAAAYRAAEAEARVGTVARELEAAVSAREREAWAEAAVAADRVLALDAENGEARQIKEEALRQMALLAERKNAESAKAAAQASAREKGTKTVRLPGGAAMEMVWCPAGTFLMGEPGKQRRVRLTQGFWMAKYEVTQRQWESVMGKNPSRFKGGDLPVESVTWRDCTEFCHRAGHGLQLPTEAQWEYACRAGTTGDFGGNGNLDAMGWYDANALQQTHPVGKKKPNAWGLHDMHGNVWEWCRDCFAEIRGGREATDPAGPATGARRVRRGGSFLGGARDCRSAGRFSSVPSQSGSGLGFRPVSLQP
jgi:formylglycine-generating enzyme required for sulfatase activity